MAVLRPYPFRALATRMFRELDERDSIFDLPRRFFFLGRTDRDLSVRFHGKRAATPLGPAAGPQSQMAQNLVLCWVGGCRILELKTVQVDDQLAIPRPCIDMRTVGYNVEWSQELKLEQSLEEYVKAAMLIAMLRASGKVPLAAGAADTVFDISVGYDLAGIGGARVQAFLAGMRDCSATVERLRAEIPDDLAALRDADFPARLSDTVTLSTFHGCPPDEIERIVELLLEKNRLHCIVKLNPMLLGPRETRRLLHDELGYDDVRVPDRAFTRDPTFDQACAFVDRLGSKAEALGLGFGVKLTNTLVVENDGDFLAPGPEEAYLSGPPLHVLAMHLVLRFRRRFGDRWPISFSGGVDRRNFPDAVALGLVPVTTCSDLLRTGGYRRTKAYLDALAARMDRVAATTIDDFVARAWSPGAAGNVVLRNAEAYVAALGRDPRYRHEHNRKPPPKIDSRLELFDCITCDKCVPVCPNDANFTFVLPPAKIPIVKVREDGGSWVAREDGVLEIEQEHQIGNFADFCNDCGNCDVFCPEDGGPYVVKPRFFGSLADWKRDPRDGFFLDPGGALFARIDGRGCCLREHGGRVRFTGEDFCVMGPASDPAADLSGSAAGEVDLTWVQVLRRIRDALRGPGALEWPCLVG